MICSAIRSSTFLHASRTPLPRYRDSSPSRNSTASCLPVEAPEGTAARPTTPDSVITSTSTVGFPLLSKISLAIRSMMMLILLESVQLVRISFMVQMNDSNILIKQVAGIVWTWRRFGMILNRKSWFAFHFHSFDRLIIQVDVCGFHFIGVLCNLFRRYTKTMILCSDFAFTCQQIEYRMI